MLKYKFDHDLDSPERNIQHAQIIKTKKFLNKIYISWYGHFLKILNEIPSGIKLELGSGGGFLKELIPEVITSDIIKLPGNDMTFSALEMPFDSNAISAIFMVDTMHHIPDSHLFLREVDRVMKPNGIMLMVEPVNSLWGRFIYTTFHHETFNPSGTWTIPSAGPMSDANGALPWIVFVRDRSKFEKEFPHLKIEKIQYINPILYLLSGGVSRKQLVPDFLYPMIEKIDSLLPKMSKQISMFMLIKIRKVAP